ncbi:MAG: hypothetical protein RPR97_03770 [Colwellia sp.]
MEGNKVLLMDFDNHHKQMIHAIRAWSFFSIDVISSCSNIKNNSYPKGTNFIGLNDKFYPVMKLLILFWITFKYNKVVVLTAPELGGGFFKSIYRFVWLMYLFLFGHKVSLYVKNSHAYLDHASLKLSIRFVEYVFFESESQKNFFNFHVLDAGSKSKISYVYYADVVEGGEESQKSPNGNGKIRVGLIGQFDTKRRDYSILLDTVDECDRAGVEFIQIGRFVNTAENREVRKVLGGSVKFLKEDYTVSELDDMLMTCDLLLSLNNTNTGYDKGKGTAAYGEAISVRKSVILPRFLDFNEEFSGFSYYYADSESLLQAILMANKECEHDRGRFSNFESSIIKDQIVL